MDELAKTEARNYLSAAGFFLIAGFYLLTMLGNLSINALQEVTSFINIAVGIGLLIVATLLIILQKRDMIALLFVMIGCYQLFFGFSTFSGWVYVFAGFLLLVALVTLTSSSKQKWLLFLIPAIIFAYFLFQICFGYNYTLLIIVYLILIVLSFYYAFACASERFHLPGSKLLTSDESTDFKASGSVLGYMLFAFIAGGYAIHYLLGELVLPLATFQTIELLCGALMIFVAILLLAVGNMRFTPVMFLLLGLTNILVIYATGYMYVGLGILWIVIGLFAMLRKESRILPGLMLIIYGCTAFFTAYANGAMVSAPIVSVILNAIPCLIAIYLSFVVYSQRKLPKF